MEELKFPVWDREFPEPLVPPGDVPEANQRLWNWLPEDIRRAILERDEGPVPVRFVL
jgi:hypothetical protein